MSNIEKTKIKITDMHCTSCALMIDGDLEEMEGIISSTTSYAKQESTIEFDREKVSLAQILEIIKKSGYSAELLESS